MTDDELLLLWQAITERIQQKKQIGMSLASQLGFAEPRALIGGVLHLAVQQNHSKVLLETKLLPHIMQEFAELGDDFEITSFEVVVDEGATPSFAKKDQEVKPVQAEPTVDEPVVAAQTGQHENFRRLLDRNMFNPKYLFENYVIGDSNRLAHTMSLAVAEMPGNSYNPLFIYGSSGLGKTHLLHAIGLYSKQLRPKDRVLYISSEEFTNDFINAVAQKQMSDFKSRYKSIDMLLIDDIQFLGKRIETQEFFFHTFNSLREEGKQVVITSDQPPNSLHGFSARLESRFNWGLLADIQKPDMETRLAILIRKTDFEGISIAKDVLTYIAQNCTYDVRQLEGALLKVNAFASLNNVTADLPLAKSVLKEIVNPEQESKLDPNLIITQTARFFDVSLDEIVGTSRVQNIAQARQTAMYLCRELTDLSLPKIGNLFGGKDHTTVMYAVKKVQQRLNTSISFFHEVQDLSAKIKGV